MTRVLFVCTGNSCRSVMAEGLFRKLAGDAGIEFAVMSAGISAVDGFSATPDTIQAMEAEGIDVSGHQSQRLRTEMVRGADLVLVMEKLHKDWILRQAPEAEGKVKLLSEYSKGGDHLGSPQDIPDPIRMSASFYRNVLAVIRRCIENLVATLEGKK